MNAAISAQIVRPRLEFERQFGQYRNWWVRDPRICGNALSIYLFMLSHDAGYHVTQTEARNTLGLGERAWTSAKKALLEAGFLTEVRDRFPAEHPRGLQRRFRLFLQDPEPGETRTLEDAVLELDMPYEAWLERFTSPDPAKRRHDEQLDPAKRRVETKPQVTPTLHSADTTAPTLQNADTFKGRENHNGLVGSSTSSFQPTNQTVSAREGDEAINADLAALHPDLHITIEHIRREVNGRVDLATVDIVAAVRDTVIRAGERNQTVVNPASYVASVVVRQPQNWPVGALASQPFAPAAAEFAPTSVTANCLEGIHHWGSEAWAEMDRSHCTDCGEPRRNVDPAYAELERLELVGGGL